MSKISELKPGGQIEIKAEIKSIQSIRKLWKCFECKKAGKETFQGLWKTEEDFMDACPDCGAKESKKWGAGLWIQQVTSALIKDDSGMVYLDLWNDDISKYKIGDKIHIVNGYARQNSSDGVNVSKGKYGQILKLEE